MTKIGLVGYGYWGTNIGRNLHQLCGVDWVAAADGSEQQRARLRTLYPWVRVYEDFGGVLEDPEVQAVAIATPAASHAAFARASLDAGKHVFVEKPLALSVEDAVALAASADERGLTLMVGHTFEHNAVVHRLRDTVRSEAFGALQYLHSQRVNLGKIQTDIDAMWSIGPHDVSISNFVVGAEPEWVAAQGGCFLNEGIADVVFATLGYSNNVLSHLHVSWLDPAKVRRTTAVGSRQMAVYDDLDPDAKLRVYDKGAEQVGGYGEYQYRVREGDMHAPRTPLSEPLFNELQHFLACIRDGQRPVSDGWVGAAVVAVLEAVGESLRSGGKEVAVARVGEKAGG